MANTGRTGRKAARKDERVDILTLLEDVGASHPGASAYTPMDRHRDFQAIFLKTDQGKRVLQEILRISGFMHSSLNDPERLQAAEGSRALALMILNTAYKEPVTRPAQATRRKADG